MEERMNRKAKIIYPYLLRMSGYNNKGEYMHQGVGAYFV